MKFFFFSRGEKRLITGVSLIALSVFLALRPNHIICRDRLWRSGTNCKCMPSPAMVLILSFFFGSPFWGRFNLFFAGFNCHPCEYGSRDYHVVGIKALKQNPEVTCV